MFKFYIHNFRGFDKQEVDFSRINILIGENNSGKSSLLKFLLMLNQTIQTPPLLNLNLREKNGYVDFGTYYEIITNHDVNKNLEFGFEFKDEYNSFFLDYMSSHIKSSKLRLTEKRKLTRIFEEVFKYTTKIHYRLSRNIISHKSIRTKISNEILGELSIKPLTNPDELEPGLSSTCELIYSRRNKGQPIVLSKVEYSKQGFNTIVNGGDLLAKCEDKYPDHALQLFNELAFLLVSQNYVKSTVSEMTYINPLNSAPNRIYVESDTLGIRSVNDIEDVINILVDESISSSLRKTLIRTLNHLLNQVGLAKEIKVVKAKNAVSMELRVRISEGGVWSNIKDVGYGVPLVIPVLFHALISEYAAKKRQMIIIEQPEIHIYPRLHAKLIETLLFIGSKNIYFIETHSEHLVRKLQLMVKQKKHKVLSEHVSINYFKKDSNGITNVVNHLVSPDGKLNPSLPKEFFDTSYDLIKELMF